MARGPRDDWGPGEHQRVKVFRERLGISQRKLAAKIGLDQSVLCRVEQGVKPSRTTAALIRQFIRHAGEASAQHSK